MSYTSLFSGNKQKQKNTYIKERVIKMSDNSNNEILESIVLMLSQLLKETADLNKKLEKFDNLDKSNENQMLSEANKRKIILNRDKTGKIIGADVIDSVPQVSENVEQQPESEIPTE